MKGWGSGRTFWPESVPLGGGGCELEKLLGWGSSLAYVV